MPLLLEDISHFIPHITAVVTASPRDDPLARLCAHKHIYEAQYSGGLNLLELFEFCWNRLRAGIPASIAAIGGGSSFAAFAGCNPGPWARSQSPNTATARCAQGRRAGASRRRWFQQEADARSSGSRRTSNRRTRRSSGGSMRTREIVLTATAVASMSHCTELCSTNRPIRRFQGCSPIVALAPLGISRKLERRKSADRETQNDSRVDASVETEPLPARATVSTGSQRNA